MYVYTFTWVSMYVCVVRVGSEKVRSHAAQAYRAEITIFKHII